MTIEDETGDTQIFIHPEVFALKHLALDGQIVLFHGTIAQENNATNHSDTKLVIDV